ncbi:protein of unknown function [Ruminococcaceae bacterium BL-6]|nr:protein of unknown function [Ruminococcaceae bacterium BL-6]
MTVKDLMIDLNKLPEDATIGTISWDEDGLLHGRCACSVRSRDNLPDEIETGEKQLDYYVMC